MGYRYIGSKDKLAEEIISIIQEFCPSAQTAIDLMAGTGLFSLHLREHGYRVYASDVMSYSFHHLVVNLLIKEAPSFSRLHNLGLESYEKVIDYLNNIDGIQGYFYQEFSPLGKPQNGCEPRMYFSSGNAAKIDAIRLQIKDWFVEGRISETEHSLLLHDLIMAANDIANIAGTYGHYLSHFVKRSLDPIKLECSDFNSNPNTEHVVSKGYAEELADKLEADFCYMDPPYIKRQYAANYHVLETIGREDSPEAIGLSGLRPWRDQYSNFCSKVKIRGSFDKILRGVKTKHFFISYSEDGLLTMEELKEFLGQYGEVHVSEIKYKRFRSNNSKKGLDITEYLIHVGV